MAYKTSALYLMIVAIVFTCLTSDASTRDGQTKRIPRGKRIVDMRPLPAKMRYVPTMIPLKSADVEHGVSVKELLQNIAKIDEQIRVLKQEINSLHNAPTPEPSTQSAGRRILLTPVSGPTVVLSQADEQGHETSDPLPATGLRLQPVVARPTSSGYLTVPSRSPRRLQPLSDNPFVGVQSRASHPRESA